MSKKTKFRRISQQKKAKRGGFLLSGFRSGKKSEFFYRVPPSIWQNWILPNSYRVPPVYLAELYFLPT